MTTQEELKYWLDSLKSIKYQLKVLEDALTTSLQQVDALEVGIRLSPLYDGKGDNK